MTREKSQAELIPRLLRLMWQYRADCLGVLLLQVLLLALGLAGLGFTGIGIDVIRHHLDPSTPAPRWPFDLPLPSDIEAHTALWMLAGGVFAFALVRTLGTYFYTVRFTHLVQARIVVDLRSKVYEKLQYLSFRFFDSNASGSIINRVTGDVQSVRMFVDGVVMQGFILVLSLGVYLAYMLGIHAKLTLVCLAGTPLLWWLSARFARLVKPAYRRNRDLVDRMILALAENIQGIQVIKAFALENAEIGRFRKTNDEVRDQQEWVFRQVSLFSPLIGLLSQLNIVLLLAYGGWLVVHNQIPLGTGLVVFTGILQQFSGQVSNIAGIANSMQQSLTAAGRVFEVLDAPVEISTPPDAHCPDVIRGEITFDHVSFEYAPSQTVLRDVNLRVAPGQKVAVVGATGSGKTALLSLVPRFYDPTAGRVLIDGRDAREYDLTRLRRSIGLVFQESFLFSTSVRANIAFGCPEADDERVRRAAEIACADLFIRELPKGYETIIGESGSDLSGGQRQRLALARAILLEPSILILDDPTAAIDPETEEEILQAMDSAMEGRTTFIVAHRLSTLRRADHIVVLDRGRIVQEGTHEELMRRGGLYQHAAGLQMADPESRRLLGDPEGGSP